MAEATLTEAPLKRKLEVPSEPSDCKKPRELLSPHDPTGIDGHLEQSDGTVCCIGELGLAKVEERNAAEFDENLPKGDDKLARNCDPVEPSAEASGSGSRSAGLEEAGQDEVLEAALEQDVEEKGDEEEASDIDTENNSVDEEDHEDADSDEDEYDDDDDDEDEDEDDSDDEENEQEMPTSTSSSLQAHKGKGTGEGKGKDKMVDVKGKGKAIAEDEPAPGSDEDDSGYLSPDPLDEVDLNNILPTRMRRRGSTHYDFVDQGDAEDDDDDSDA